MASHGKKHHQKKGCCGEVDDFHPVIGYGPRQSKKCVPRCRTVCAEFSCCECNHKGEIKLKIPYPPPIYFTAKYFGSLTVTTGTPVTIPYNVVVAASDSCSYNPQTGIFCLPKCGSGFYSLTSHTSILSSSGGTVTVAIISAGISLAQSTEVLTPGVEANVCVCIGYPLSNCQCIMVVVTLTGAEAPAIITQTGTNFSLVKASEL